MDSIMCEPYVMRRRFGQKKLESITNYLFWSGNIYKDHDLMCAYLNVLDALNRYRWSIAFLYKNKKQQITG